MSTETVPSSEKTLLEISENGSQVVDRRTYGEMEYADSIMALMHRNNSSQAVDETSFSYECESQRPIKDTNIRRANLNAAMSTQGTATEETGKFEKILIRMDPRPPSVHYVEAMSGSQTSSTCSSPVKPHPKLEWLTKMFGIHPKNETSSYTSDTGTQTTFGVKLLTQNTVFGSPWQFGGTFMRHGGILQTEKSDVSLTLTIDAVCSNDYVDIFGAIFTDIQEFRKKFEIAREETLITPLVEYCASNNYQFQRHLKISLPHALPDDYDHDSLKVYTFNVNERGEISVQVLPPRAAGNTCWEQDMFWKLGDKDQQILIWTKHFSGYFCTACSLSSRMPSICTRVFGSHVQVKSKKREIRIVLYIWDRRLKIRDYMQRINEQECDMDRQLLADKQITLLESATSKSHIIMKMDTLGDEEDRACWRHITRPNTGRPLYRPLQTRKLSQVVECCQQADPMRVEWAMENVPDAVPDSVFQCCIDMLHVSESVTNFEEALQNADEDVIGTFYVRRLALSSEYPQSINDSSKAVVDGYDRAELVIKRVWAQLSLEQMESTCARFGLPRKDFGNICKKFSGPDKINEGLIEECCKRVGGPENFYQRLPDVLKQMGLFEIVESINVQQQNKLTSCSAAPKTLSSKQSNERPVQSQRGDVSIPDEFRSSSIENTHVKSVAPANSSRTSSNIAPNGGRLAKQMSVLSNEVFYPCVDNNPTTTTTTIHRNGDVDEKLVNPINNNSNSVSLSQHSSPTSCQGKPHRSNSSVDSQLPESPANFSSTGPNISDFKLANDGSARFSEEWDRFSERDIQTRPQGGRKMKNSCQKSSSSGSDSALRGTSIVSSEMTFPVANDSMSMEAQADSNEFNNASHGRIDDVCSIGVGAERSEETSVKELAASRSDQRVVGVMKGFEEINGEKRTVDRYDVEFGGYDSYRNRVNNGVSPNSPRDPDETHRKEFYDTRDSHLHRNRVTDGMVHNSQQDPEETSRKEFYGRPTCV